MSESIKKSNIKRNFAYQMVYEILVLILPFITSPYISRVIGAEGLGIYSYSYSIAYYFVIFSNLGIINYGNRTIAKVRDNPEKLSEIFSNLYCLHLIVSIIFLFIYLGYIYLLKTDKIYAKIQIFYVFSALLDISWFYFGIENFKLTVIRSTIVRVVNIICIFIFVKDYDDLWKYCLILALGNLLSQLTLWIPLRTYTKLIKPKWSKMKSHLRPMLILFIPAIAVSLYKYMDKIMLGFMSSKSQLGLYENAEKVINIPLTVITSFGTVMLPKMSNLVGLNDKCSVRKYILISMEFIMCLSLALSFGIASVGTIFATVFWGQKFSYSGILIMGLSTTIPFIAFANVIRTQFLIPNSFDKEYLISVIAGAVVNLIINSILIPYNGALGATIGTIATEMIVCIWQTITVRKQLPIGEFFKKTFPFFPISIGMFVVVYSIGQWIGTYIITLFIQIFTGSAIYVSFCFFYFYKTKNQIVLNSIRFLKKKWSR